MSGWIQDRPRRHLLVRMLLASVALLSTLSIPLFAAQNATDGTADSADGISNDSNGTLEIGIFPYLSVRTLLITYQPLQQYLQTRLQRPVLFVTAPDLRTFVKRTQRGEYRFVLTAPHFARLAQQEAGYLPMLRTKRDLHGVLIVDKDSPLHHVRGLRGKIVATPDSIAIITMLGAQLLRANNLRPGKDVILQAMPSHDAAVLAMQKGESAAAIVAVTALQQMPQELRSNIRILATSNEVPSIMFLAHPKTPRREVADMTRLLLEFIENTPEGRKFMNDTGYLGLRPPSTREMKRLDPYVGDLKTLLGKR